jgi:hypothetical protein
MECGEVHLWQAFTNSELDLAIIYSTRMGQQELKDRLIHTKRGAIIVLCSTSYVAVLSFRNLLLQSQHETPWLIDPLSLLPAWAVAGINLGFCACLIWGLAVLYRLAQGNERVLVGAWVTSFLVGLIKYLASAPAGVFIDYVKALAMLVVLLAAVDILFRMPASGYPRLENQTSRNA